MVIISARAGTCSPFSARATSKPPGRRGPRLGTASRAEWRLAPVAKNRRAARRRPFVYPFTPLRRGSATPQRLVQRGIGRGGFGPALRQQVLGLELGTLGVQHLKKIGDPLGEPHPREV